MKKVSIIIPIYNVAQYVRRCLESVSKQTYQGEIECILVDDCGSDNSADICKEYINGYKGKINYSFLRHKDNGGLSVARNSGTKIATGDYLFYMDSDDEIPENAIELLMAEADKHPGVDIVVGYIYDDKQSAYYDISVYKDHQYVEDNDWIQYNSFNCHKVIPVNAYSKLIRKEFIISNNLYFKPGIIHEDVHWMFFVARAARSMAFVFQPTYIRYWHEGSIITSTNKLEDARNWHEILMDLIGHLDNPFFEMKTARFIALYFEKGLYKYDLPHDRQLRWKLAQAFFKAKMWKGAALMALYNLIFWFRKGWIFNYVLYDYSFSICEQQRRLYHKQ